MPAGFYWGLLLLAPLVGAYSALGAKAQNWLLLLSSVALMAAWDVRFPVVALGTTAVSYALVSQLQWERPDEQRRRWLWLSVAIDVGVLLLFRYLPGPPRAASVSALFTGATALSWRGLAAPVGLSFFTLARMTHTFDVYYRFDRPTRSLVTFLTFTLFFPLLLSGPIERATRMLPVFAERRVVTSDAVYGGAWLILLGVFQKVVVADRCAILVSRFLGDRPGTLLTVLGILAYALQIFADFSGYSDVARGVARLFGIEVTANFRAPYFSRNLSEYWRRWHVSLSSWLDDYIYKPTGMRLRDLGMAGTIMATMLTFLVSASWHGRGLTFLVWGGIHAVGLSLFMSTRKLRKRMTSSLPPRVAQGLATLLTLATVCLGYVFFRAPSVSAAFATLAELARPFPARLPERDDLLEILAMLGCVGTVHYLQLRDEGPRWIFERPVWLRAVCYAAMLFFIARLPGETQKFIYFQF